MKQQNFNFKPYYTYLAICLIYFMCLSIWLFFSVKGEPELFINQHNFPFFDVFFSYYTYLGDGWFYSAFNVFLLFVGFYEALVSLVSILITAAIVQYFKLSLFHNTPRPKGFFPADIGIHYVNGVDIHLTNSFPSGHTSTGMCLGMILAFLIVRHVKFNQNSWFLLAFVLCFLIGFSRVYLMQHFFVDTLAGTFIGTGIPLLVIFIFEKYTHLNSRLFWSRSLLRLHP